MEYDELLELRSRFMRSAHEEHLILFLGQNMSPANLPDCLHDIPWACIITSRREHNIVAFFGEDTNEIKIYDSANELMDLDFHAGKLPFIFLYGHNEGSSDQNEHVYEYEEEADLRQEEAGDMMRHLWARMTQRCVLVFCGYNPDDPKEFPYTKFIGYLRKQQTRRLAFFVGKDTVGPKTLRLKEKFRELGDVWHPYELADVLSATYNDSDEDTDEDVYTLDDSIGEQNETFYVDNHPVMVDSILLLKRQYLIELLTEERLHAFVPYGKEARQLAFHNFLNNSSTSPQWYGYLPQSELYVQRSFEKPLVALVADLLDGKNPASKGSPEGMPPVIVYGAPGSSKSVELAALAYRIFCQKKHPVIYIKTPNATFAPKSDEFIQLRDFIEKLERNTEKRSRTLIVWDSSAYRNTEEIVVRLQRSLADAGRRCVLVCSSYEPRFRHDECHSDTVYELIGSQSKNAYRFKRTNECVDIIQDNTLHPFYHRNCFYVCASRYIDSREIADLKKRTREYILQSSDDIVHLLDKIKTDSIFAYFYQVITMLRKQLASGLSREQKIVSQYVQEQCQKMALDVGKFPLEDRPFEILRNLKLGDATNTIATSSESDVQQQSLRQGIANFSACVAMFSRFHLNTPFSLAFHFLCSEESNPLHYAMHEVQKLAPIIRDLTYIRQTPPEDGDFFAFRMPLEAELYLKTNNIDVPCQLELVKQMLDIYIKKTLTDGIADLPLRTAILELLRMLGPNSKYHKFAKGGEYEREHKEFLKRLDVIINALNKARTKTNSDPQHWLAVYEINFSREFYGNEWSNLWPNERQGLTDYHQRLEYLKQTNELILQTIKECTQDSPHINHSRNILDVKPKLYVEQALCSIHINMLKRYVRRTFTTEDVTSLAWLDQIEPLPYQNIYETLWQTILQDPLNGYYYNTLLRSFQNTYEHIANEERKLQLLAEILMVVDQAELLDIQNRGMNNTDELSQHIAKIRELQSGQCIMIDHIHDASFQGPFRDMFNNMIAHRSAAAICMVCRNELQIANINSRDKISLTAEQRKVCRKVLDFMDEDAYVACVTESTPALYLKLLVNWMYYDGHTLNLHDEWQLTHISRDGWRKIEKITDQYHNLALEQNHPLSQSVEWLRALASIQLYPTDGSKAYTLLKALRDTTQITQLAPRMHVPYLVCDESGTPRKYNGTVTAHDEFPFTGWMELSVNDRHIKPVRYNCSNLGLPRQPEIKRYFSNLSLGLSLAGSYAACNYQVVSHKGGEHK